MESQGLDRRGAERLQRQREWVDNAEVQKEEDEAAMKLYKHIRVRWYSQCAVVVPSLPPPCGILCGCRNSAQC